MNDAGAFGNVFNMDTSESNDYSEYYTGENYIKKLTDF